MAKIRNWLKLEKEDLDKRIRSYPRYRAALLFSAIVGFLVSLFWLWGKIASPAIKNFDFSIMNLVVAMKTPLLVNFFSWVTWLGSGYFLGLLFLILAIFLILRRRKRAAVVTLVTLLGSAFLAHFFRNFFERPRPDGCLSTLLGSSCFSFPSGHSTGSLFFYGLLDYLVFRFLPISLRQFLGISLGIALLVLLVGISRVFLGVHYPSDIMAGFFLGGSWLLLAILLIDLLY